MTKAVFSRRAFLAGSAATPFALRAAGRAVPVGLELYSVRGELKKDLPGTLKTVAGQGYQCVEFFAPYRDWTPQYAREVRRILDGLNLKCYSTHNHLSYLETDKVGGTVELNQVLGARYVIISSAGDPKTLDGWKTVADKLNGASEALAKHHLRTGYHNHDVEFTPIDKVRPIEVLARNTSKNVVLQLDVGTCLKAGSDPVAWIKQNPGRIRSLHCKDWSVQQDYSVLFGEGSAPWPAIFAAAESAGGVEYYLVEQEGSRYSEFETAKRCFDAFKKVHSKSNAAT